jgi:hypothetical protein
MVKVGRWKNEFNVDLVAISVPTYFSQLGDNKVRKHYKIAKHYLNLQEWATRTYELRHHHFYLETVVHNY